MVGVFDGLFLSFLGIPTNIRSGITFVHLRLGSEMGGPQTVFPGYHVSGFFYFRLECEGSVGGTRTYNKNIGHDMGYSSYEWDMWTKHTKKKIFSENFVVKIFFFSGVSEV